MCYCGVHLSIVDSIIVSAVISAVGAAIIAVFNRENEHRTTVLEEAKKEHESRIDRLENIKHEKQFSEEEKKQIMDMTLKVSLLWTSFEKNIPLFLKNPEELDSILQKLSEYGIEKACEEFTEDDKDKLFKYLQTQLLSKDGLRRMWAALYLDMMQKIVDDIKC
jgi:hypothetical protein